MNVLVFGAGFSAAAAIAELRAARPAARITATTRDPQKAAQLGRSGLNACVFDGQTATEQLREAIATATHLLVSIAPNGSGDPVLSAFSHAIGEAPELGWIGYYSTIGVYGDADGAWIDEDWPTQRLNARIGWRLDAEADWQDLARRKNLPLAILRLAGIYGPGRSAFDKLRSGTARRIVKPGQVFNRIHNGDIGAITALAAQRHLDGIFNLADDEPAPPQDVVAHAAALLGMDPPPEIAFDLAEMTPMARSFYAGNRRVSNRAIRAALGYELRYKTYREGLAAILARQEDD